MKNSSNDDDSRSFAAIGHRNCSYSQWSDSIGNWFEHWMRKDSMEFRDLTVMQLSLKWRKPGLEKKGPKFLQLANRIQFFDKLIFVSRMYFETIFALFSLVFRYIIYYALKVSRFRKQIILSSHTYLPKKPT